MSWARDAVPPIALAAALATCASFASQAAPVAAEVAQSALSAPAPTPDLLFKLAKGAWNVRRDVPFVTYNLRERYTWRGRVHDNWWTAYYRDVDRHLVLHRMVVPENEAARMKGFPIGLNVRFHKGTAKADSFDTNPDADAFPILDPLIAPNGSFGLLPTGADAALVGDGRSTTVRVATPQVVPESSPVPDVRRSPAVFATEKPLRELIRVEAFARDYAIAYAGTERIASGDAYHLTLVPLRDPEHHRLRDLWLEPQTFATLQLSVQGLFEGRPYDAARWIVTYVRLDERYYVQKIAAAESLRFGMDRTVSGLEYDFVAYDFPSTIPDSLFRRLL